MFRTIGPASIAPVTLIAVFWRYWLPVIVWMALIFSASADAASGARSSRIIEPIIRWVKPDISRETLWTIVVVIRKTAHVLEYAVLAMLLWRARRKPALAKGQPWDWSHAAFAIAVAALYALTDEIHQSLVPNRGASFGDVCLDTAGAVFGVAVVWVLVRWRSRGEA